MWAFWRRRIHTRRRAVNLACSCSGEARLHRIDLIREDASDPLATRSRDNDSRDYSIQPARVLGQLAGMHAPLATTPHAPRVMIPRAEMSLYAGLGASRLFAFDSFHPMAMHNRESPSDFFAPFSPSG